MKRWNRGVAISNPADLLLELQKGTLTFRRIVEPEKETLSFLKPKLTDRLTAKAELKRLKAQGDCTNKFHLSFGCYMQ